MGSKYTPEHLASISADPIPLSQRLRGDYGIRSFDTTPIQHVAADALDAKDARIRELEEAGRLAIGLIDDLASGNSVSTKSIDRVRAAFNPGATKAGGGTQ